MRHYITWTAVVAGGALAGTAFTTLSVRDDSRTEVNKAVSGRSLEEKYAQVPQVEKDRREFISHVNARFQSPEKEAREWEAETERLKKRLRQNLAKIPSLRAIQQTIVQERRRAIAAGETPDDEARVLYYQIRARIDRILQDVERTIKDLEWRNSHGPGSRQDANQQ